MPEVNPEQFFDGKDDAERMAVAHRIGKYLTENGLSTSDRRAAELLAEALVNDAIERVRLALSEAIKHAMALPRSVALKLAHDVDPVSCPFLAATEVFNDSDWQQLVLTISQRARLAVAGRSSMSETLANSLLGIGDSAIAVVLVENSNAPMTEKVCDTVMDRFEADDALMDQLASRNDLTRQIAIQLMQKVSEDTRIKLENAYDIADQGGAPAQEPGLSSTSQASRDPAATDPFNVVKALYDRNELTPPLLLSALAANRDDFFEAGLTVLSGLEPSEVRKIFLLSEKNMMDVFLTRANIPADMRQAFKDGILKIRARKNREPAPQGRQQHAGMSG